MRIRGEGTIGVIGELEEEDEVVEGSGGGSFAGGCGASCGA